MGGGEGMDDLGVWGRDNVVKLIHYGYQKPPEICYGPDNYGKNQII